MDRYRMYIGVGVYRHSPSRVHDLQNGSKTQTEPQGNCYFSFLLPNTILLHIDYLWYIH